jgi:hypothetical protein
LFRPHLPVELAGGTGLVLRPHPGPPSLQTIADLSRMQFGEENIVITLVGTKLDLIQAGKEREVTREEIDAFCKEHGDIQYIETVRRVGLENLWLTCDQSSKDGTNVEEVRRLSPFRSHARHGRQAFAQTAQLIHERIQSNKIRRPQTKGSSFPNLAQSSADALSRKGCC